MPQKRYSYLQQSSCPPRRVYQSYFAAIIDELGVFTPEKHFITTVGDLFIVLDVLRQSFSKPKQHVIDLITATARQHNRNDDFLSQKVCIYSI
jgi:hypothetical protein